VERRVERDVTFWIEERVWVGQCGQWIMLEVVIRASRRRGIILGKEKEVMDWRSVVVRNIREKQEQEPGVVGVRVVEVLVSVSCCCCCCGSDVGVVVWLLSSRGMVGVVVWGFQREGSIGFGSKLDRGY
jgi:hypothetical protein